MVNEIEFEEANKVEQQELYNLDKTEPSIYPTRTKHNEPTICIPISDILSKVKKDATIVLVVSDLHAGDSDFLPKTYESCVDNAAMVVDTLSKRYNIKNFNVVLNGDMVSGREVYRYQHLRNLVQRGHWQVELAAHLTRELTEKVGRITPVNKIFVLRGNHENRAENYPIYLTHYLDNVWYAGHHKVLNIAYPIGNYNVLFTHGFGGNSYYPVSLALVRDCWKAMAQYRLKNINIEEIATGHTHWLQPRLMLEGLTFNVTGGFQRWEFSMSQRPSGMLLFIYTEDNVTCTAIRPDLLIEEAEKASGELEFTNMEYYAKKLKSSLQRLKKTPPEVVL